MDRWDRALRRVAWATLAGLALVAAGCGGRPVYASTVVEPPAPMPDVQLRTGGGRNFRVADLRGHPVALYVGYTHCPDVCPVTMSHLGAAFEQLPASLREDVKVVMITADPARDTPDDMTKYVHFFNDRFIGVSGDTATVLAALREWGISPECSTPSPDGAYTVTHPASVFILDRNGALRLRMPHDLDPAQMARDLTQVAREGKH